jgi:hypothetical protein
MNLGENPIEMRISRSLGSLANSVSRILKPFLVEFITRSRVTMIFQPEEGTWKIVHRHADPITSAQPAESVIQE